jgi:DNA polymerase delta subunit 1
MSWTTRQKAIDIENDLVFQTLDWYCEDQQDPDTNYSVYTIYVFGVNAIGEPVSLKINDYLPFFFIEIPTHWTQTCIYSIKDKMNFKGKSIEFLQRKRYYGFENNKIRKFLKLSFYSYRAFKSAKYLIQKGIEMDGKTYKFELYESNIDPVLRLTHLRDILTAGWVTIKKGLFQFDEEANAFACSWKALKPTTDPEYSNKMADIKVMYFDIEACSEDGSFPNALKKNDHVTQICCINKTGKNKPEKFLFNLGTIDTIEDTVVMQYSSEKKLLLAYARFIRETDPDIIVGYNIFGFDNGFLFERAKVLGIEESFNYQSKIHYFTSIVEKKLDNQQSGFNQWKMTRIVGRIHIDLLQVIKKDFKLESYKLNYVGEHFLKEGKDDVSPKEIFEAWSASGDREKRTRVGKYCVQDTNLCLLLFEKFAVLPNHIEMAKVTRVPFEYLITRGQSIKVFSQIAYQTRLAGYLIPELARQESEGKFQGATVLEAHVGYYDRPVAGLDFASLYPSIMIAHNMCYSTVVLDPKYLDLPNIEYSTIKCNDNLSVTFVQNQDGVLSGILQSLWKNRKITKKEMNAATDPFVKTVLNAKQLAIKVSMNSIYGFTGATVGALPCLEISQSVTGCGRQMIEQTQNYAKNVFNCEIVYGDTDSCYVIFPEPVDPDGTLTTLFKKAEFAAAEISKTFKKPIELEFEKFMYPLILVAKKRYMYLEWTDPKHHNGEIEAKGVELVRRDNCPYVKETLDGVLQPIMFKGDVQLGRKQAEYFMNELLSGKVPIKKLILSKTLKNEYKNPDSIAHYQLVEKMKLRDINSAPKPGDRVPFVYVDIQNPKALSWEKVEDPVYALENNIPIDSLYYLEHQLISPLETIFEILLGPTECKKMIKQNHLYLMAKKREKQTIADQKRIKDNNNDIRKYFKV